MSGSGKKNQQSPPQSVVYSKNYKRPHIIHLMALTDITKSENGKYGQKNHFLWIKNHDGLMFKDTAHHGKRFLCNRCTISFPSKKSRDRHQDHCFGWEEDCQKVDLPVKGVNDFEQFKNYGRMINAPCVIIADFEVDNKKWDCSGGIMKPFKSYEGQMRKLAE